MKKKLEARLSKLNTRYAEVTKQLIEEADAEARAALGKTLEALKDDIDEVEGMLKEIDEPTDDTNNDGNGEGRSNNPQNGQVRGLNILSTMQAQNGTQQRASDPLDTPEYRNAFMEFACRGVAIPMELRNDVTTKTSDASAVIPTTILNEIVSKLQVYGNLYARVRKINVQGGVKIPILSLKPVATWITADTATSESEKQKIQANTSVTFSYYGLECKIAQTLLVNVTTLEMFQNLFSTLAVEAIVKALDIAIISGDGSGEPLGITNDTRVPSTQIVTISTTDVLKWDKWKKQVFAKIPTAYRKGSFIMAQGTFDGYIDGMVDSNGQPVGRVNYGIENGESYRFGGKEVIIVEPDVIKDWDSATGHASTGDVIAVFCNLTDYAINSNLEMQTVKWIDHDTNEIKNKVILIADGKLVDPNGVVIVKKGV